MWIKKTDFINEGLNHLKPCTIALMLDELLFYKRHGYKKRFEKRLKDIIHFCEVAEKHKSKK